MNESLTMILSFFDNLFFELKYWLTYTKWRHTHGWKKEFAIIEKKTCSCGLKYELVNGFLEGTSICKEILHMNEYHPEEAKSILVDTNCFHRENESEVYQAVKIR